MAAPEIHTITRIGANGTYSTDAIDIGPHRGGSGSGGSCSWNEIADKPNFARVATTGSWNDLSNKPDIPSEYDDTVLANRITALENAGNKDTITTLNSSGVGIKITDEGQNGNHSYKITGTSVSLGESTGKPTVKFTNGNGESIELHGGENVFVSLEESSLSNSPIGVYFSVPMSRVGITGLYNDLLDKPTVDAAMSDTSKNPVQNKVVLSAIGDAIDIVETAIADRYTRAETDAKIAEAMIDVDNEHFHAVTALPDPAVAKENHEYVLITYAQDGTTIESETHYLFYGGAFHLRTAQVSLEGYATEQYVGQQLDTLANVALSGLYNDLLGKPVIPEAYDDTALAARVGANETAIADRYTKAETNAKAVEAQTNAQTYADSKLSQKQDTLVSGTNIKTLNGESILGSGNLQLNPIADYEVCINDVGGNVVQIGTIKEGEDQQNLYQFFYRTDNLGNTGVKTHSFANLLANYTVNDFIDATGITSNGIFIGNGRTDNENRLIVQQFSRNNKNIQIRTYQDFSGNTALIKVIFKGKFQPTPP